MAEKLKNIRDFQQGVIVMKKILPLLLLMVGMVLVVSGSWIHVKAQIAQYLLHDAWNQTSVDGGIHKPWNWADHWPVARLSVEAHGIKQIVLSGDSGNVLAFAPGLNKQLALPGLNGTAVISGHRDTHFRFLEYLKPGEIIDIELPDGKVSFQVRKAEVVDSNRYGFNPDNNASQLLLVTCYPFDAVASGGPLRYVVTANRVM